MKFKAVFSFVQRRARPSGKKREPRERLWLIRLPIFFSFYRLIFPRNFWKILKSRPVFFPVEFKNSRIFIPIIENFSTSVERIYEFRRGSQISIRTFFSPSTNEQANEWRSQFVLDIFPLSPQDPSFALIMPEIRHSAPGYSLLLPPNKRAIFPLPPRKNSLSARIFIRPLIEIRFSRVERGTPPRSPWSQ